MLTCFSPVRYNSAQALSNCADQFKIEKASLSSDLGQIADTINSAYKRQPFNREDYPRISIPALIELLLDEKKQLFYILSAEKQICGTILLHDSEISLLSVHPAYQRQGLGARLLQQAENEAFKIYNSVSLKVIPLFQENLVSYYESVGYKSFGEFEPLSQEKLNRIQEQYQAQVSALIMRKAKPPSHD